MTCILCGVNPPIKNSHVIPKFSFRRLKQGSPVNAFVHSGNVNRLVEDGWKGPFLCKDCEKLFSGWETYFVNHLLDPFLQRRVRVFTYDERLALFSASLHFRNLAFMSFQKPGKQTSHDASLQTALQKICNTQTPTEPDVYQYFQLVERITDIDTFPPGINTYLFEAVDASVQQNVNGTPSSMSYVKLPGALLVASSFDLGNVLPEAVVLDEHTIDPTGVYNVSAQSGELLRQASDIIIPKVHDIQRNYSALSPSQRTKIQSRIKADQDREVRRAHRSYIDDRRLLAMTRLRDRGVPKIIRRPLACLLEFIDRL